MNAVSHDQSLSDTTLLALPEAAAFLGLAYHTVRTWGFRKLPRVRGNGQEWIRLSDVRQYADGMKIKPKDRRADDSQRLLDREEAAKFLGYKPGTLAKWVYTERYSLPVLKIHGRSWYRLSDLKAFQNHGEATHAAR